jgi:Spy/CpxP family protein refolding chaperone
MFGPNAVSVAIADLRASVTDAKSTPAQLQEKIAAVRKARQQAQADLAAAQKQLLELLTPDQEAVLVSLGYLD